MTTLLLILLATPPVDDPLAALASVTPELEAVMQRAGALLGTPPALRFFEDLPQSPDFKMELEVRVITKLKLVGFEFELLFYEGRRPVYYLRTFLKPGPKGARYLNFEGRAITGESYVKGVPLSSLTGPKAPFALAAAGLAKALASERCPTLTPVSEELLATMPPKHRKRQAKALAALPGNVKKACAAIRALKAPTVHLRLDDIALMADPPGPKPIVVRTSFGERPAARFTLEPPRIRE